jgi:hypothetical protein
MNRMILLDVGNMSAKAVLVDSGRFAERWKFDTKGDPEEAIGRLVETGPEGFAYSSVVPDWTGALRSMAGSGLVKRIVEAGHLSGLPFTLSVEEPEKVGPDRLCAAVGAREEHIRSHDCGNQVGTRRSGEGTRFEDASRRSRSLGDGWGRRAARSPSGSSGTSRARSRLQGPPPSSHEFLSSTVNGKGCDREGLLTEEGFHNPG